MDARLHPRHSGLWPRFPHTQRDGASRLALPIEGDTILSAQRVVRVLEELRVAHSAPQALRLDNGPEFRSLASDEWTRKHGVELHFTQPGKPTQNAYIERIPKFAYFTASSE